MFWDRKLEERAVVINYLLIPPNKMIDEKLCKQAYNEAFDYVVKKLLPEAGDVKSDEHLALSFLTSYLESADEFARGYLLAAMLVASNESGQPGVKHSVGKKLGILCEHMGPAYVKLAQAIHSHPSTPEKIRQDLDHVKGRANPPHRWQLWRMVIDVLPNEDKNKILKLGSLLGSASYNLAIEVQLLNGRHIVLSLLRENAAKDAAKGFNHLKAASNACAHERVVPVRNTIIAMINEADLLSVCEMNHEMSSRQFAIAETMNRHQIKVDGTYTVNIFPTRLFKSGNGYRFIELIHGIEFNDLPATTPHEKEIRKAVAKSILITEFIHILGDGYFDCDRHGNQLRIRVDEQNKVINAGMYDFGEMSLAKPTDEEVRQFADVIKDLPKAARKDNTTFGFVFDQLMSEHISVAMKNGEPISYLMRVRKGILALQDFQKHLNQQEMIDVLIHVTQSRDIHPVINDALSNCNKLLKLANAAYVARNIVNSGLRLFSQKPERSKRCQSNKNNKGERNRNIHIHK